MCSTDWPIYCRLQCRGSRGLKMLGPETEAMRLVLTEGHEDVGRGLVCVLAVRLVSALHIKLHPLPLLLVAGLASVTSPAVVALGHVHADIHRVVTCHSTGDAGQITTTVTDRKLH